MAGQLAKTQNLYDDALLHAMRKPLGALIWVLGISFAAAAAGGENPSELFLQIDTLRHAAVVGLLAWFALRFIKSVEANVLVDNATSVHRLDDTTIHAIAKLLRATVLITGILLVLQAFGISVAGVLAFGGIGGIAIGFAARDLLANFLVL